jgi:uncharacterized protein (TIGR02001 family)
MRTLKIGAVVTALAMMAVAPAAAQFSFQVDTMSRYIWRGFDLFAPDNPAFQPSATYTFGESGFSANVWTSFALGDRRIYKYDDEIDLTLTYAFKLPEDYALSVGLIHYGWYFDRDFTFKRSTTQEFFVTAGLPKVILEPSVSVYYDVTLGTGLYACLKIGHSLPLGETLGLNLNACLGYNSRQWIDASGWSDLTLGATLPIKVGALKIAPLVNYTFVFLKEINPENEFWFGLSLIY